MPETLPPALVNNGLWRTALWHSDLPTPAKVTGAVLAEHGWGTGEIRPPLERMMRMTSLGRGTVKRALHALEAAGWVTRVTGTGRTATRYVLTVPLSLEGVHSGPPGGPEVTPRGSAKSPSGGPHRTPTTGFDHKVEPQEKTRPHAAPCPCGAGALPKDDVCARHRSDKLAGIPVESWLR